MHEDVLILQIARDKAELNIADAVELPIDISPQRYIEDVVNIFRENITDMIDEVVCNKLERGQGVSRKIKRMTLKSLGGIWRKRVANEIR